MNNEVSYNKSPKLCQYCNIVLPYKQRANKYCSHSCSAKQNNLGVVRNKRIRHCIVCNSELSTQRKYCSSKCIKRHRYNVIENGSSKVSIDSLRRYLFKTREHKCEICLGTAWLGRPIPLVMDHIDGNPANDSVSNLRLICPNCDRFLPTFGSRNRGFGRKSRGLKRGNQL